MIPAAVAAVVALLGEFLPFINSASQVAKVISILVQVLPTAAQLAQDLVQPIKNIILALQNNPATTQAQQDALKSLDTLYDAQFEAAATNAEAEDAAADAQASASAPTPAAPATP